VTVAATLTIGGISATGSVTASGTAGGSSASADAPGRGNSRGSSERPTLEISTEDLQSIETRLARKGLHGSGQLEHDGATCAEHAYGQVKAFFERKPCTDLYRAQLELKDRQGDTVLVAISWVEMPDESSARAYKTLVDAPGTGNVTELSRESGRYRTIRYTGLRYHSNSHGTTVSNVQAEPVARGWTGIALQTIVNAAD
jgi:hypothetical protein